MKTVVLAFDIERTGAKPENETIAIGMSIVDENFNQLDSRLCKGYIKRPMTKEDATIDNAPEGFEPRSWVEFWYDKKDHLDKLCIEGLSLNEENKNTVEKMMIGGFQEFRKKWEYKAEQEGFNLEICSDNPTYDCWFINELICKHFPEYHPLPYNARKIRYNPLWDTDSMLRGLMTVVDPEYKGPWGFSNRIRELYEIKTENIGYDHMPHHDAYNIGCDAQIVLGIREGRILKK